MTLEQTIPEALAVSHDCWNRLVVCCASRLQDRDFLSTFNFVVFGMLLQVIFTIIDFDVVHLVDLVHLV